MLTFTSPKLHKIYKVFLCFQWRLMPQQSLPSYKGTELKPEKVSWISAIYKISSLSFVSPLLLCLEWTSNVPVWTQALHHTVCRVWIMCNIDIHLRTYLCESTQSLKGTFWNLRPSFPLLPASKIRNRHLTSEQAQTYTSSFCVLHQTNPA